MSLVSYSANYFEISERKGTFSIYNMVTGNFINTTKYKSTAGYTTTQEFDTFEEASNYIRDNFNEYQCIDPPQYKFALGDTVTLSTDPHSPTMTITGVAHGLYTCIWIDETVAPQSIKLPLPLLKLVKKFRL